MQPNQLLPRARAESVIIQAIPGETLVFDQTSKQAHCLNATATLVWSMCDGHHTAGEAVSRLAELVGVRAADDVLATALGQLAEAGLLASEPARPGLSRRRMLGQLSASGVAAALAPVVLSITARTAQAQASALPPPPPPPPPAPPPPVPT